MRKIATMIVFVLLFTLIVTAVPQSVTAANVTVSGNDLASALKNVSDGGTVTINGTCSVPSSFVWPTNAKNVTIKGGTLDLSSVGRNVYFNCGVTFDGVTLTMAENANVHCCGNRVVIKENVRVTNRVGNIFAGGGEGSNVDSTDLTVLSGNYGAIHGGSYKGTVKGDTRLTVGGSTNASCDWTDHSGSYFIYGGGVSDTVNGNVYLTFTGDARANYIYGGGNSSPNVKGDLYVTMSGGHTMSLYGGFYGSNRSSGGTVHVVMTGGELEQIFGGNQGGNMVGNVDMRLLGGRIKRRVYGGCYNETGSGFSSMSFVSSYYVSGNIRLTIGGGVNIDFSFSGNDKSIYAHSRQKSLSSSENTEIIFADSVAYSKYKDKLKAQDTAMKIIMGSVSAADSIHYYTYSVSGTTVTEKCSYHSSYTATATLSVDPSVSLRYTGDEIKAAKVTYSDGFEGDRFDIVYKNNVNAGTATATISRNDINLSVTFDIVKADQSAPSVSGKNETVAGKSDGRIIGLTSAMEISSDGGNTYRAVTNANADFAPGTYLVRLKETENQKASPSTTVTILQGGMLTVTFKADGTTVATKKVSYNGSVTDLPSIPQKEGYTQTPPKWSVSSLSGITSDITVNAVYTANKYTVTFKADGRTVGTVTVEHGKTVTGAPSVPEKTGYSGAWESKVSSKVTGDVTVNAVYTELKPSDTSENQGSSSETSTLPDDSDTEETVTTPNATETDSETTLGNVDSSIPETDETTENITDGDEAPVTTDSNEDVSGQGGGKKDLTTPIIIAAMVCVILCAVVVIIVIKRKR